ncbi:MAG: FliM/FliN family flagellar motor switch protein [Deltaproteobacteria bacterium]|nr:FliM/FliN family flagellar motor switch protein [Deltaproteobacteria bacterium]
MGRERQLRSALSAMAGIAASFARAARRSLPFLARYRATIVPTPVTLLAPIAEGGPSFSIPITGADGSVAAAVTVDANAIAVIVEGALGGSIMQNGLPPGSELTAAQRALLSRIGRSLALDLASSIKSAVGLEMSPAAGDTSHGAQDSATGNSLFVACEIEGLPIPATITLQASAEALESAAREQDLEPEGQVDPRVAQAVLDVPVEIIAELGRVTLGVGAMLKLRPGDIIRLPTATDDTARVYAAGVHKLDGIPVTSRGQLAIEIRTRHDG